MYKNEKTLTDSSNSSITVKLYRNPSLSEYVTLSTTITSVSGDITTVLDNVQSDLTSNLDRYGNHDKNTAYLSDLKTWLDNSYTNVLSNVEIIDSSLADLYKTIILDIVLYWRYIKLKSAIDTSISKSELLTKISDSSGYINTLKPNMKKLQLLNRRWILFIIIYLVKIQQLTLQSILLIIVEQTLQNQQNFKLPRIIK